MYVWRVPFPAFVAWGTTVVLLCVVAALLWLRRRAANAIARGLLGGGVVIAILASSVVVGVLVEARAPRNYDPSPWLCWSPAIFAVCVGGLSALSFRAARPRLVFVAAALVFALANFVNRCQPGWCEEFGFPFTYWDRSDAFIRIDGVPINGHTRPAAAVGNAAILLMAAALLALLSRRSSTRARTDDEWEELARRDPYFAILTDDRFHADKLDDAAMHDFFASGERDVDALLRHTTAPPASALDFGCGAGRLTLALAKRVAQVVGVDVSPTMRELAERHRIVAGITNARFVDAIPDERFDFICSLIVFQHIPVERGEALFRELLARLSDGGVATIELAFSRPGGPIKKLARRLRAASPLVHRIAQRLSGDRSGLPYMQMNVYDLERIRAIVREAGCTGPALIATRHGDIEGAIVVATKAPATASRSAR